MFIRFEAFDVSLVVTLPNDMEYIKLRFKNVVMAKG